MPPKRVYRRRPRKTFRKRRSRKMVMYRRPQTKIYSFKRSVDLLNWNIDAVSAVQYKAYGFALSDLPTVTDFTALFDQFRILAVKITFYPQFNQFQYDGTASGTKFGASELYSVIDYDDSATPASLDELNQFSTLKRRYFNRPYSRYFKPQIVCKGLLNSAGTNDGYFLAGRKRWLDMATPNVLYQGLKVAFASLNTNALVAQTIRVQCTYYFQCKNVR